jgi:hypothetical protein
VSKVSTRQALLYSFVAKLYHCCCHFHLGLPQKTTLKQSPPRNQTAAAGTAGQGPPRRRVSVGLQPGAARPTCGVVPKNPERGPKKEDVCSLLTKIPLLLRVYQVPEGCSVFPKKSSSSGQSPARVGPGRRVWSSGKSPFRPCLVRPFRLLSVVNLRQNLAKFEAFARPAANAHEPNRCTKLLAKLNVFQSSYHKL